MALADLIDWMGEYGRPGIVWYAKRLAANDTLATDSHQAGPYIAKRFLFRVFPSVHQPSAKNPDFLFDLYIDSHADHRRARAVWYNSRPLGTGTRDEGRVTRLGGASSAMLDPESTGAVTLFAFVLDASGAATEAHAWVCRHETEADLIEERLGPIEPGTYVIWEAGAPSAGYLDDGTERSSCQLDASEIPASWLDAFPSGEEIVRRTLSLRPLRGLDPDVRLLKRRSCEYEVFQSIEAAFFMPRIKQGFTSVSGFIGLAQTILQSRKSRSGNSLELHAREILTEDGLKSGTDFSYRPVVDGGKRPDFLFPSKAAYDDLGFPAGRLRMLAAKTTCKDRWRQVLNEAGRIPTKHLLTLQRGVSKAQFSEMVEAGVQLVVPEGLHNSYPKEVRPHLMTFESFIADARLAGLHP